jgi:hypothetical protein
VTGGGACFRSPNYPNDYGASEDCAVSVSGAGLVRATAFDTESGYDYVTIDGTKYDGSGGALATTTGVAVSDGETVSWHTDSSHQTSGFEICGVSCDDSTCGHGSCGAGGTTCVFDVCTDGYTGAHCEVTH